MKKRILIAIGLVAAALVSAMMVLYFTVDAESFRGFIEARAGAVLDRDVELGELQLSILPVFGLQVDGVSVGARPEEGGGDILSVRRVDIGARLLPLLDKRLEVTSLVLVEPSLRLARGADGRWNLNLGDDTEEGTPGDEEPEPPETATELSVDSLRVTGGRLSVRDASRSADRPLEMDLTDLDLVVSGLGTNSLHVIVGGGKLRVVDDGLADEPLELVLDDADLDLTLGSDGQPEDLLLEMGLGGDAGGARVAVRGRLGGAEDVPTTLRVEVERLPLTALRPVLPAVVAENVNAGMADLALDIAGRVPGGFTTSGDLSVAGMKIELTGDRKIDARLALDFSIRGAGEHVEMRTFDVVMGGNTIGVTGTIEGPAEGRRIDLEVRPTRVAAADLSFLLALGAPDLGLSITGESPVEIGGGVRGLMAGRQAPEVRGRMKFSGITVEMAALSRPVTDLDAEVTLLGPTIDVKGLRARVGDNDLAGTIKLTAGDVPTVGFDLEAQHADLDELLTLMSGGDGQEESASNPPDADSFLVRGVAEGTLRVAGGMWADLSFRELDAHLRLANGVATLDPVSMELYDGRFRGRLVSDLKAVPTSFEFSGDVEEIDMAPFLADQIDGGDLLTGRLTGRVTGRGSGTEPEAIIRSLEGEGTASIVDGEVGKLDVLETVGQVAGILGQRTLANLATTMTTDATRFSRMDGNFQLSGGRLRFEDLLLQSAAFSLGGAGDVDLVSSVLNGAFQIRFSPEVSAWMKQESSRASELFWDAESARVILPLGLSGPFDNARASVDWTSAATGLVQRTVENEIANLLGGALGGSRGDSTGASADGSSDMPTAGADANRNKPTQPAASPAPRRGESPSGKFAIEVTKTSWGGSFLAQDYKIEGKVSGLGVKGGRIVVVDASGGEIQRKEITNYSRQPGTDDWIFKTRADGKSLVLAGFPVTVTLTALGADGETAEVTLEITR